MTCCGHTAASVLHRDYRIAGLCAQCDLHLAAAVQGGVAQHILERAAQRKQEQKAPLVRPSRIDRALPVYSAVVIRPQSIDQSQPSLISIQEG